MARNDDPPAQPEGEALVAAILEEARISGVDPFAALHAAGDEVERMAVGVGHFIPEALYRHLERTRQRPLSLQADPAFTPGRAPAPEPLSPEARTGAGVLASEAMFRFGVRPMWELGKLLLRGKTTALAPRPAPADPGPVARQGKPLEDALFEEVRAREAGAVMAEYSARHPGGRVGVTVSESGEFIPHTEAVWSAAEGGHVISVGGPRVHAEAIPVGPGAAPPRAPGRPPPPPPREPGIPGQKRLPAAGETGGVLGPYEGELPLAHKITKVGGREMPMMHSWRMGNVYGDDEFAFDPGAGLHFIDAVEIPPLHRGGEYETGISADGVSTRDLIYHHEVDLSPHENNVYASVTVSGLPQRIAEVTPLAGGMIPGLEADVLGAARKTPYLSETTAQRWLDLPEHKRPKGYLTRLENPYHRPGAGMEMYWTLLKAAQNGGVGVISAGGRTVHSEAMYQKLVKLGVPFRRVRQTDAYGDDVTAETGASDGRSGWAWEISPAKLKEVDLHAVLRRSRQIDPLTGKHYGSLSPEETAAIQHHWFVQPDRYARGIRTVARNRVRRQSALKTQYADFARSQAAAATPIRHTAMPTGYSRELADGMIPMAEGGPRSMTVSELRESGEYLSTVDSMANEIAKDFGIHKTLAGSLARAVVHDEANPLLGELAHLAAEAHSREGGLAVRYGGMKPDGERRSYAAPHYAASAWSGVVELAVDDVIGALDPGASSARASTEGRSMLFPRTWEQVQTALDNLRQPGSGPAEPVNAELFTAIMVRMRAVDSIMHGQAINGTLLTQSGEQAVKRWPDGTVEIDEGVLRERMADVLERSIVKHGGGPPAPEVPPTPGRRRLTVTHLNVPLQREMRQSKALAEDFRGQVERLGSLVLDLNDAIDMVPRRVLDDPRLKPVVERFEMWQKAFEDRLPEVLGWAPPDRALSGAYGEYLEATGAYFELISQLMTDYRRGFEVLESGVVSLAPREVAKWEAIDRGWDPIISSTSKKHSKLFESRRIALNKKRNDERAIRGEAMVFPGWPYWANAETGIVPKPTAAHHWEAVYGEPYPEELAKQLPGYVAPPPEPKGLFAPHPENPKALPPAATELLSRGLEGAKKIPDDALRFWEEAIYTRLDEIGDPALTSAVETRLAKLERAERGDVPPEGAEAPARPLPTGPKNIRPGSEWAKDWKEVSPEEIDAIVKMSPEDIREMSRAGDKNSPLWRLVRDATGDGQRNRGPEDMMVRARGRQPGGSYPYLLEHVGDLTHRMSQNAWWTVKQKVERSLRKLRLMEGHYGPKPYEDFDDDYLYHVGDAAEARGVGKWELEEEVGRLGELYAAAHKEHVPVFNEAYEVARDAAIAVGQQRWFKAERLLAKLEGWIAEGDEAFARRVNEVDPDRLYDWARREGFTSHAPPEGGLESRTDPTAGRGSEVQTSYDKTYYDPKARVPRFDISNESHVPGEGGLVNKHDIAIRNRIMVDLIREGRKKALTLLDGDGGPLLRRSGEMNKTSFMARVFDKIGLTFDPSDPDLAKLGLTHDALKRFGNMLFSEATELAREFVGATRVYTTRAKTGYRGVYSPHAHMGGAESWHDGWNDTKGTIGLQTDLMVDVVAPSSIWGPAKNWLSDRNVAALGASPHLPDNTMAKFALDQVSRNEKSYNALFSTMVHEVLHNLDDLPLEKLFEHLRAATEWSYQQGILVGLDHQQKEGLVKYIRLRWRRGAKKGFSRAAIEEKKRYTTASGRYLDYEVDYSHDLPVARLFTGEILEAIQMRDVVGPAMFARLYIEPSAAHVSHASVLRGATPIQGIKWKAFRDAARRSPKVMSILQEAENILAPYRASAAAHSVGLELEKLTPSKEFSDRVFAEKPMPQKKMLRAAQKHLDWVRHVVALSEDIDLPYEMVIRLTDAYDLLKWLDYSANVAEKAVGGRQIRRWFEKEGLLDDWSDEVTEDMLDHFMETKWKDLPREGQWIRPMFMRSNYKKILEFLNNIPAILGASTVAIGAYAESESKKK